MSNTLLKKPQKPSETLNKIIEDTKLFKIQKSYLQKDEFIKMLELVDFVGIKTAHLELLTGLIIEDGEVKILSKTIDID